MERGLTHLYVGDGKGKTTAAAGLAVRALGCGKRVVFCQFLKGRATGEISQLEKLGATVLRAKHSGKFTFQMDAEERAAAKEQHQACFAQVLRLLASDPPDLLVLDEAVDAVNAGLLAEDALCSLLRTRPASTEVVLTGRNPSGKLCGLCDYHTDFVCRKHPYQSGVAAREGIEF